MNITQALAALGATDEVLTERNKTELDEKGFTLLPGVIDDHWLEALRSRFEEICEAEGARAGLEVDQQEGTRRVADLVNKGEAFDGVYTHPMVLAAIYRVIARDFKLSSLNGRDALPGEGHQGPPHRLVPRLRRPLSRMQLHLAAGPLYRGERLHQAGARDSPWAASE